MDRPVNWLPIALDQLAEQPVLGYLPGGKPATEPTALAALALAAHGHLPPAQTAAQWLQDQQTAGGAVGVRAGEAEPGWPTSLAVLAWAAADRHRWTDAIARAVSWLLSHRGKAIPRSPEFGHNTELIGWAYAENTHSWVEPTSLAVLALCAAGRRDEPALGEAVTLLLDRQLPGGGWNYGNTYVLGQLIRPHLQPTGLALLALATAGTQRSAIDRSASWLAGQLGPQTPALSLGWSLLGLRAVGHWPHAADEWLAIAAVRKPLGTVPPTDIPVHTSTSDWTNPLHRWAVLALAAKGWPL